MDGLDWDGAEEVVNSSASWENPQESLTMPNYGGFTFIGGKIGLPEDIFTSIQLLQKTGSSSHFNSLPDHRISHQLFQHSASASNPIQSINPGWNFSQQEQPIKLADDDVEDKVPRQSLGADAICSPPKLNSTDHFINQLNGLFSDYGMANKSVIDNCLQEARAGLMATATTAGSTDSLDCLLSASNSNTDTSVEDDAEISKMLFSNSKNLWNFRAVNAVSSGESACYSSTAAKDIENHKNRINEIDDRTAKQTPSDQIANQVNYATKRSSETLLKNLVHSDPSSIAEGSFQLISENQPKPKKPRSENHPTSSKNINFQQSNSSVSSPAGEPDSEAIAQMKEMIYRAAAFRPVNFGTEIMEKPKRKNVRISTDPQTVAARQRREKISERIRVLQRLVPGGSKMDTASMLDEAANYLKFLRSQVKALEAIGSQRLMSIPQFHSTTHFP
ncbi:hypothetical protein ACH5RR_024437 [Cinchona calisaya]|uniref:BHLH domain-containing protein n=1 Tax=Cinchona calisaya TaxID=153742 RepID=A0ABD2Z095_9GENT